MMNKLYRGKISEHVPASCFYDPHTILNTNGTLMRVVRLPDFRFTTLLLDEIQALCGEIVNSGEYGCTALWINTVRSRVSPALVERVGTDGFAVGFSKAYRQFVDEKNRFSNDLFISIVSHSVLDCTIGWPDFLLKSLIKRFRKAASEVALSGLEKVAELICKRLAAHQPVLLDKPELLDFLGTLLCVDKTGMESGVKNIAADLLVDRKIFFGFNTFEIVAGTKTFGTSFSVKSFRNSGNLSFVREILGIQSKMVITEIISTSTEEGIKSTFGEGLELVAVVKEDVYQRASSKDVIAEYLEEQQLKKFCLRSFEITLFSESIEKLASCIEQCERIFIKHGFMIVREDLLQEEVFWGNLPGTFHRMRRWETVLLKDSALFACTHTHFRCVSNDISKSLTRFISIDGDTHYFSFPDPGDYGHAVIFGKKKSGRIELQNFLLLEACVKYGTEFLIIDEESVSEGFVRAVKGVYLESKAGENSAGFKCNLLDITDVNILSSILTRLCSTGAKKEQINGVAEKLLEVAPNERNLDNCAEYLQPILGDLSAVKESFGYLFASDSDSSWLTQSKLGISLDQLQSSYRVASALAFYIIEKYVEVRRQSARPFIIVIQNPERFHKLFSSLSECESFLRAVSECGGLVLFSSDTATFLKGFGEIGKKYVTTKMLVPLDGDFAAEYNAIFAVSGTTLRALDEASLLERCFFLRQGEESIILKFDLSAFDEKHVLSSRGKVEKMKSAVKEAGDNPDIWLPIFYRKCK